MMRREPTSRKPTAAVRRRAKPKAISSDAVAGTIDALDQLAPKSPKAKQLIAMLRGWLVDESGYDEQSWPKLKKALDRERRRIGARRLFDA